MTARIMPLLRWGWIALVTGLCLWPMPAVMADEQWGRLGYLIVTPLLTLCCFAKSRRHWQLLYPALLAVTWSILLPMAFTLLLSFSNYSWHYWYEGEGSRVWSQSITHTVNKGVVRKLLFSSQRMAAGPYDYSLFKQPDGHYFLQLSDPEDSQWHYYSVPIALLENKQLANAQPSDNPILLALKQGMAPYTGTEVGIKEIAIHKKHLDRIRFTFPDSQGKPALDYQLSGLRKISGYTNRFLPASTDPQDDSLIDTETGQHVIADDSIGNYRIVDQQGKVVGKPLEPGYLTYSLQNGWHNVGKLFWLLKQQISPQGLNNLHWLGIPVPDSILHHPLLYCLFWSFGYALLTVGIGALLASINAYCLQYTYHPLRWLRLLVLPAAIPLTLQCLIAKGLLHSNFGELALLQQTLFGHIGFAVSGEVEQSISAVLICSIWALIPLMTLWFYHLAQPATGSLRKHWLSLWPQAKPALLMLFSVQLLAYPFFRLCWGEPSFLHFPISIGITDTVQSMAGKLTTSDAEIQEKAIAMILYCLLFIVALLLGWWRYRALQQQPPLQTITIALQQPRLTGKPLPRLWLGTVALLLWLPLLLLLMVALRQGHYYPEAGSTFWQALPTHLSLDHFKSAFNIRFHDQDGVLQYPPYPFMQWLSYSLRYAGSITLLTLVIALPAAWAMARYQFVSRQSLYRLGIMLQTMMPALLVVALYHLVYVTNSPIHRFTILMVANLGIVPLAIFPLTTALQQLGNSLTLRQALRQLSPTLLTLGVLLFLQQIGENVLIDMAPYDHKESTVAQSMQQYLYPSTYLWGDFAAAMVVLAVPLMALFYWLVPRIDRNLINHWRPM